MSFAAYRNYNTGEVFYAFEGEECKLPPPAEDNVMFAQGFWDLFYEKLPPNPSTILATNVFMTDFPYLDSMKTMYELDRILNIEAEQEREDRAYQDLMTRL